MRYVKGLAFGMLLVIGLTGCSKTGPVQDKDANTSTVQKQPARDIPQPQEKYGFAPIGE